VDETRGLRRRRTTLSNNQNSNHSNIPKQKNFQIKKTQENNFLKKEFLR